MKRSKVQFNLNIIKNYLPHHQLNARSSTTLHCYRSMNKHLMVETKMQVFQKSQD